MVSDVSFSLLVIAGMAGSKGGFFENNLWMLVWRMPGAKLQSDASNNLSIIYWHLMHCASRPIKVKLQFSIICFSNSSVAACAREKTYHRMRVEAKPFQMTTISLCRGASCGATKFIFS